MHRGFRRERPAKLRRNPNSFRTMRLEPPRWWHGVKTPFAAWALWPAAAAYGGIAERRFRKASPYRSALPVICVGNFTMGGAGKTPVSLKLAALLRGIVRQPAFLTRGYGGSERGPYLVDGEEDNAERVGDEPLLLARNAPTVVSRDRQAGARFIEAMGGGRSEPLPAASDGSTAPAFMDGDALTAVASTTPRCEPPGKTAPDLIIMDDGFQNPSLAKDFCLVVVDGGAGIGNARVFPMGPLRAPLDAQLARADAIVILGAGAAAAPFPGDERLMRADKPLFRAEIVPVVDDALLSQPVLAFCGIGRPGKFFTTLKDAGIAVAEARAFPDHHPFTEGDARALLLRSRELGARLLTTEKDRARLKGGSGAVAELRDAAAVLPIDVRFRAEDQAALMTAVAARLR
ncbi:tetraacyldisaccharide 4'-kinase [Rhodomicrobium lacus]|uniref:tetraacyldisaccharide 4'-kinase n=1 Tax=Rhodomicrobium lacus TaxID=2498452 RepID=UPI0026E16407|nr:tetraacyldisaccharide 4'-kinase [Rhodomicrobium lacus]WKW49681.1 tetraacyldisaccharide 4'-kinase [Rhodomicrobium lacus]